MKAVSCIYGDTGKLSQQLTLGMFLFPTIVNKRSKLIRLSGNTNHKTYARISAREGGQENNVNQSELDSISGIQVGREETAAQVDRTDLVGMAGQGRADILALLK